MSSALKIIYTIFLGILVAIFVGFGIEAFYPSPTMPEVLQNEKVVSPEKTLSEEETLTQQQAQETYAKEMSIYNRNVFIIALLCAVIILAISLTIARNIEVIADGLLLGGTLTLFYSIGRGVGTQDNKFRFLAVTIGLIITLVIGYFKFIKAPEGKKPATQK